MEPLPATPFMAGSGTLPSGTVQPGSEWYRPWHGARPLKPDGTARCPGIGPAPAARRARSRARAREHPTAAGRMARPIRRTEDSRRGVGHGLVDVRFRRSANAVDRRPPVFHDAPRHLRRAFQDRDMLPADRILSRCQRTFGDRGNGPLPDRAAAHTPPQPAGPCAKRLAGADRPPRGSKAAEARVRASAPRHRRQRARGQRPAQHHHTEPGHLDRAQRFARKCQTAQRCQTGDKRGESRQPLRGQAA